MRFLVVTMHAGEPQLERCTDAVRAQEGVDVEHVLISDLPNVEAHARCYEEIQARSADYDVAVKLDADMVLSGDHVLETIGRWFVTDPELDHGQLALHDFFTDRAIMGLHVFSPRVRWPEHSDGLFVDAAPIVPGRRAEVWQPPIPIADHAPDPTPRQALGFGVHRGQKAFQWDRRRIKGSQARDQWRTLVWTWEAFERTRNMERGAAVYAADLVWRRTGAAWRLGYNDESVERILADMPQTPDEMHAVLAPRWSSAAAREVRHVWRLGVRGSGRLVAAAIAERRRERTARTECATFSA